MSDNLRDRIAVTQQAHVFCITECSCGHRFPWEKSTEWRESAEWAWALHVADAVIEALGPIPNRSFVDDRNNRWEWCGGEPGTWAWRITRLGPEPLHPMYPRNYPEGRDYEPF